MADVDMKLLPAGTNEGDVLKFDDGTYTVDAEETFKTRLDWRQAMEQTEPTEVHWAFDLMSFEIFPVDKHGRCRSASSPKC